MLLDSRLQQPLQNGPFPHGDGKVAALSEGTGLEGPTPLSPADSFFFFSFFSGPACALVDLPASEGSPRPPSRTGSLFDLYSLTWPLVSASLTVCVSVLSWACPAVPLFLVEERCWADCLPLPFPSVSSLLPLPCALMLVLPLPHHSVLRYSICYSSLHDSHDHPLFSTCLSPSPCCFLLFPFLLCPCLRPPPYPQGTPCTLPALPAIGAALRSSLHCVGSLPLLHPCYSNPNTRTHTLHKAGPPWLTSANSTGNTHTLALEDSSEFHSPTSYWGLQMHTSTQSSCLLNVILWLEEWSLPQLRALQGPIKTCMHTHTYTHTQRCTRKHAATQPLSNKSAALLHPVRLNQGSALQTCCPVSSPWLISAQSSAQSHVCRREQGWKAVLWSLFLGSIILHPSLSLLLLSFNLHALPPSPPLLTLVCRSQSCQLPLFQCSVPISALCSPSLSLCLFLAHGTALSLSHSVSMQYHHPLLLLFLS